MNKILIISFRPPYPLTDGFKIRSYNIGKILSTKYQVDLLAIKEGKIINEHLKELEKIFNKVIIYSFNPMRFKINTLKGLLSNGPLQTYYYYFREVQKWIDNNYTDYDLIFCIHLRMAKYLREIEKPKVIDLIDATSINYKEAQEKTKGLWRLIYSVENRRLLSYELSILKQFKKAFLTSPFDKEYLDKNSEYFKDNLIVIPNGVKEELLTRINRFEGKEEDWLIFLGKMNYAPNVDAVTYFAKEIFPLVRKEADVKFFIVGTNPAKEVLKLRKLEGVEVTGFVDDPYEYLERAKVVVAPLRFSAGIQNKILEAMALRKAVVTTSKGIRGIAGKDGEHFLVADNPIDMAEKIMILLHNQELRKRLGEDARRLVETTYQWELIGEKLLGKIDEILDKK